MAGPEPMRAATLALEREAAALSGPLPALLAEAERVAATIAQGVHGRRRVGAGETFWQFRRYQSGDDASQIDWRQSAKSDAAYIRENEWDAAESIWLWPDRSASMAYASPFSNLTKEARARVLALALASLLVRGGERVALLSRPEPPASGRTTLRRLSASLIAPESDAQSLPPQRPLPRHAMVVMLSDFLSPLDTLGTAFEHFALRGVKGHLLQILDPAEEDLPFRGRTRFAGVEEPHTLTVGRAEDLRDGYQAALGHHRAGLRELARRFGWSFASHRTDRPPQTALLALYAALAGTRRR
jgi:uncharacterized protein (DUF58 family)